MSGILYGVGVGPGDPELMTLKAVRLIRENETIAVPGKEPRETVAYKIAVQAVPELAQKELLPVYMPMTHDRAEMERSHEEGARLLEASLAMGKDVIFLTLGDPSVYSTFTYLQKRVGAHGYETRLISGVPSFCAAAARFNLPLAEWNEPLHILPAAHRPDCRLDQPGNYILMKAGRRMAQIRETLLESGREVYLVENCGMEGERVFRGADQIPDDAGYYSLVLAKERRHP